MFQIGDMVKTRCGSRENPYWEYGAIIGVHEDDSTLFKVEWGFGCYDYLLACELEPA